VGERVKDAAQRLQFLAILSRSLAMFWALQMNSVIAIDVLAMPLAREKAVYMIDRDSMPAAFEEVASPLR
jgi:hypothetical protein